MWNVNQYPHTLDDTEHPPAPWRRFMQVQGPYFCDLFIYKHSESRGLACIVPKFDMFPWLDNVSTSFDFDLFVDAQIECKPAPSSTSSSETIFHMIFYEIVGPTNRPITKNMWKAGPLHSDQRQHGSEGSFDKFLTDDRSTYSITKAEKQYKTAVRYLRESAISVSNQI